MAQRLLKLFGTQQMAALEDRVKKDPAEKDGEKKRMEEEETGGLELKEEPERMPETLKIVSILE